MYDWAGARAGSEFTKQELKFFRAGCNFSAIGNPTLRSSSVGAVQSKTPSGGDMKKLIARLMAMCFLALSLAAFAQTGSDASKDTMKQDSTKKDTMKKDSKKSAKVQKTSTKKDSMKKDSMKKDDTMKNDSAPKQ
jgi:pentapeptide MXKDX repeat protein